MLSFHAHLKVFVAATPCDLRARFNGLWSPSGYSAKKRVRASGRLQKLALAAQGCLRRWGLRIACLMRSGNPSNDLWSPRHI